MNSKEKIFWTEFLELYESMPCLWKIMSVEYCNRDLKNKSYSKLVEKLKEIDPDANREKVVKKINVFRTNFKRDLKKIKKSEKSGAGVDDVFESSLWYFEKLKFLEDQECSLQGKCTMDTESLNNNEEFYTALIAAPSKKRKITNEDNLLKMAGETLGNRNYVKSVLAKGWASRYEELSKAQKVFTRTIFADVLFHGCLDKLTEKTVEDIHKVLKGLNNSARRHNSYLSRASTPYFDEHSYSCFPSYSSRQHFEQQQPPFSTPPEPHIAFVQNNQPITGNYQILTPEETQQTQSSIGKFFQSFTDE